MTHLQNQKTGNECSAWVVYVDPDHIPFSSVLHQLHINETIQCTQLPVIYLHPLGVYTPCGVIILLSLDPQGVLLPRGQEMMLIALGQNHIFLYHKCSLAVKYAKMCLRPGLCLGPRCGSS